MATSSKVHLSPSQQPVFCVPGISSETADTASELLQENHDKHHVFFNYAGFHNHIAHHLLTLFALNASPAELKQGYDDNVYYQRPSEPIHQSVVSELSDPNKFKKYLGNEKYYHDYMVFFQQEMDNKGWPAVLNEYLFKGDERADDMLVRVFASFLHPIIHLGFGVEFEQPAIIAEALAQTAVHARENGRMFTESEKAAKSDASTKTIVELLEDIRASPRDMVKYTSQVHVSEKDLEEKTAEMINAAAYYTGAAQHPAHQVKFDFWYIHAVNCGIFFSSFLAQPWLSAANKARLLEWKIRADLAMYASQGSPQLLPDEITNYKPTSKSQQLASWPEIFKRVTAFHDDGHANKLVRALAHGEQACKKFDGKQGFVIKGDMWVKLGNMAIDSVEAGEPMWVRGAGYGGSWSGVPRREDARGVQGESRMGTLVGDVRNWLRHHF